jgi:hypothetical protein
MFTFTKVLRKNEASSFRWVSPLKEWIWTGIVEMPSSQWGHQYGTKYCAHDSQLLEAPETASPSIGWMQNVRHEFALH